MNKKSLAVLFISLATAGYTLAAPVDLKGTWVGLSNSAVMGYGQHHPGSEKDPKIRFTNVEYTITINAQKGQNFSGTIASKNHKEDLVGAISKDFSYGELANENGRGAFKLLNATTMELCYSQTGPQHAKSVIVASCFEFIKR